MTPVYDSPTDFFQRWLHSWRGQSYTIANAFFLRLLSAVYCVAFLSYWTQVDGLVGNEGILPHEAYLQVVERVAEERNFNPYLRLPTLCWLNTGDGFFTSRTSRNGGKRATGGSASARASTWARCP